MTVENFMAVLDVMHSRRPFQVYTVELNTGKRFEVDHPTAVVAREGLAMYLAPEKIPVWFDHESVTRIIADGITSDA